jgi:hypothetical protein
MKKIYVGKEIPGMIEPIEQELLETLARGINFDNSDCVVEFGSFFGRSTACISAGLEANESFDKSSKFYAYDAFKCEKSGWFYPNLLSHAKKNNVERLLETDGNTVNFFPIFEKYLSHYISSGILFPEIKELKNSFPKGQIIKLMHIDSPKFYSDFKFILYRFFPHLKEGSFVVFQDFFYHWSPELIAICGMLVKNGFLKCVTSAASSLLCIVEKPFNSNQINEIDLAMSAGNDVPELIDFSIEMVKEIEVDRGKIFQPRLLLAKIQWLYESGRRMDAVKEFANYLNSGNVFSSRTLNEFLELMSHGFSLRDLYEKDHISESSHPSFIVYDEDGKAK